MENTHDIYWVSFPSENYLVCPPAMDSSQSVRLYLPPYTSKEELQAGAITGGQTLRGDALCAGVGGKDRILVLTKEHRWGRLGQLVLSIFPERKNATLEQAGLYKL